MLSIISYNYSSFKQCYILSLHDALPIFLEPKPADADGERRKQARGEGPRWLIGNCRRCGDRKSTRLNSSHLVISYAVFCLKNKIKEHIIEKKVELII